MEDFNTQAEQTYTNFSAYNRNFNQNAAYNRNISLGFTAASNNNFNRNVISTDSLNRNVSQNNSTINTTGTTNSNSTVKTLADSTTSAINTVMNPLGAISGLVSSGLSYAASIHRDNIQRDQWNKEWDAAHSMGLVSPSQIPGSSNQGTLLGRQFFNTPRTPFANVFN